MTNAEPPRVLFSYSWDSEEHKEWVRLFAERLRLNGVDVRLDQWHVKPGQSLTQFMESEITTCERTLVICTPEYRRKAIDRQGGVGYEHQIISGHIVSGGLQETFIPILREGSGQAGDDCALPPPFLGIQYIDLRDGVNVEAAYEQLLRTIFGTADDQIPPIGAAPSQEALEDEELDLDAVRLPTKDLDGYDLISGLAQNHRHPDSFLIPSEQERRALQVGDVVKLFFDIVSTDPDAIPERMWVIVERNVGPYYVGRLDNDPVTEGTITAGSPIIFLPEHVINIWDDAS
jgi:hypothetical protein